MKYAITHCYTDKNKGDAAIVIATIQLIRSIDKNAEISLFSTYGYKDVRLKSDHTTIINYANNLYPSFFSEPVINFGRRIQVLRLIPFIWELIKSSLLMVSDDMWFTNVFLSKQEKCGFKAFISSDFVISKGGSYLYTENSSIRSSLSLIRMLFPLILAWRYKKKTVIFSQSIGPVVGGFNNWLFKYVLSGVNHIYLREKLCRDKYQAVKDICGKNAHIVPDTAFYLKDEMFDKEALIPIDRNVFNVGFTVVNNDYKYLKSKVEIVAKKNNYKNCMIDSIKFLIDRHAAVIHVFPQVLVDMSHEGHNDLILAKDIKESLAGTKYYEHINVYTMDLSPVQLRNLYRQMDIFIGTRLHSVIFALSVSVPSISIAYHGTKAQGILMQLDDQSRYVVDINTVTSEELIRKIQELYEKSDLIRAELPDKISTLNEYLEKAMRQVLRT